MRILETITLSFEELEAIRLKDHLGLQQEECAEMMAISPPTFRRVLGSGRAKVAEALIGGKGIRIEGGTFEMAPRRFRCGWDGHEWEVPFEKATAGPIPVCPRCRKANTKPLHHPGPSVTGRGGRQRRGRGWQDV